MRSLFFCLLFSVSVVASAVEADLEALLGESGRSALYPQKEALPYDESEPHLEIGGLRVEAVEALFSGRARILAIDGRVRACD